MARIFKKWFMSPETEIFIYGMAGITITALEQSVMNANEYLQEVQNAPLPSGYFGPSAEQRVKTILSLAVLARSYTVYAYLISYFAVLGVAFFSLGRQLLVPWLVLSVLRHFVVDVAVALTGIFICLKYQLTPVCIEFILVRVIRIVTAAYMWRSVRLLYDELAAAAASEQSRRSLASYALSQEATRLLNRALLRLHMLPPEEEEAAAVALGTAIPQPSTSAAASVSSAASSSMAAVVGAGARGRGAAMAASASGASVDVTGRPLRRHISEGLTGAASAACAKVRPAPDADAEDFLKLPSRSLESLLTMLDYNAEALAPLVARRREERRAGEGAPPRQRALFFLRLTERDVAAARRRTFRALVGTSTFGVPARVTYERQSVLPTSDTSDADFEDDEPEKMKPQPMHSLQSLHMKLKDIKCSSSSSSSGSGSPPLQVNNKNDRCETNQKTQSRTTQKTKKPQTKGSESSSSASSVGANLSVSSQHPPDITVDSTTVSAESDISSSRETTSRESSFTESTDKEPIVSKKDSSAASPIKPTCKPSQLISEDTQENKKVKAPSSSETETESFQHEENSENQASRITHESEEKTIKRKIRQQTSESTRCKEGVRVENTRSVREISKERKRCINFPKGRSEQGPTSSSDSGQESSDISQKEISRKQFNRSSPYGASNATNVVDKFRRFTKSLASSSTDAGAMGPPNSSGGDTGHGSKPSIVVASRSTGIDFKNDVPSVKGSMPSFETPLKEVPFIKKPTRPKPNLKRTDTNIVESKVTDPKTAGPRVTVSKTPETKDTSTKLAVPKPVQSKPIPSKNVEVKGRSRPIPPSSVVGPVHTSIEPNVQSTEGSRVSIDSKVKTSRVDKEDSRFTLGTAPSSRISLSTKPGIPDRNRGVSKLSDKNFAKKQIHSKHIDDLQRVDLATTDTPQSDFNILKTKPSGKTDVSRSDVCPPNITGNTNIVPTTTATTKFLKKKISRKPLNKTSGALTADACLPSQQEDKVPITVPAIKFLRVTSTGASSRDAAQRKQGFARTNSDVKKAELKNASSAEKRRSEKQERKISTPKRSLRLGKQADVSTSSTNNKKDVEKDKSRISRNLSSKVDELIGGNKLTNTVKTTDSTVNFIRELLFEKSIDVLEKTAVSNNSQTINTNISMPDLTISVAQTPSSIPELNDRFQIKSGSKADSIVSESLTTETPEYNGKDISQDENKNDQDAEIYGNRGVQQMERADIKSSIEYLENKSNSNASKITDINSEPSNEENKIFGVESEIDTIAEKAKSTELIEKKHSPLRTQLNVSEGSEVSGVDGETDNANSSLSYDRTLSFDSEKSGSTDGKDLTIREPFANATSTGETIVNCIENLIKETVINETRFSEAKDPSKHLITPDSFLSTATYVRSIASTENITTKMPGDSVAGSVHSMSAETKDNINKIGIENVNSSHEESTLEISEYDVDSKSFPSATLHPKFQSAEGSFVDHTVPDDVSVSAISVRTSDPFVSNAESCIVSEHKIEEKHTMLTSLENALNNEASFQLNPKGSETQSVDKVSRDGIQFDSSDASSNESPSYPSFIPCESLNAIQYSPPAVSETESNLQEEKDNSLFREIETAFNNVSSTKAADSVNVSQKELKDDVCKHVEEAYKDNVVLPNNIPVLHSSYAQSSVVAQLALKEIVKSLDVCSDITDDKNISSDNLKKNEVRIIVYSVLKEIVDSTDSDFCNNKSPPLKIKAQNTSTTDKSSNQDVCSDINNVLNNVGTSLYKKYSGKIVLTTGTIHSLSEPASSEENSRPTEIVSENECENAIMSEASPYTMSTSHEMEMKEASSIVQSVLTQVVASAVKSVCASDITSHRKSSISVESSSLGDERNNHSTLIEHKNSISESSIVKSIFTEIIPIITGKRSNTMISPLSNALYESQRKSSSSHLLYEANNKFTAAVEESIKKEKNCQLREEEYCIFHSVLGNIITAVADICSAKKETLKESFLDEHSTVIYDDNDKNAISHYDSNAVDIGRLNETELQEKSSVISSMLSEAVAAFIDARDVKPAETATSQEISSLDENYSPDFTHASTTDLKPSLCSHSSLRHMEIHNTSPSCEATYIVQSILKEVVPTIITLCSAKKSAPDVITSPAELTQLAENASNISIGKALARDVAPALYETVSSQFSKSQEASWIVDSILKEIEAAVGNVVSTKPLNLNATPSRAELSSNSNEFFQHRNYSARRNAICSESMNLEVKVLHKPRSYESRVKEAEHIVNSILNDAVSAIDSGVSNKIIAGNLMPETKLEESNPSDEYEVTCRNYDEGVEKDSEVKSISNTPSQSKENVHNTFDTQTSFPEKEYVAGQRNTIVGERDATLINNDKVVKTTCPDILSEIRNEITPSKSDEVSGCTESKEILFHDVLSKFKNTGSSSSFQTSLTKLEQSSPSDSSCIGSSTRLNRPEEVSTPPSGYLTPDCFPAALHLGFPPEVFGAQQFLSATKHTSVVEADTMQSNTLKPVETYEPDPSLPWCYAGPTETPSSEQQRSADVQNGGESCGGAAEGNAEEGEQAMAWPNSLSRMSSPWWSGQGAVPQGYFPAAPPETPWTDPEFYASHYETTTSEAEVSPRPTAAELPDVGDAASPKESVPETCRWATPVEPSDLSSQESGDDEVGDDVGDVSSEPRGWHSRCHSRNAGDAP